MPADEWLLVDELSVGLTPISTADSCGATFRLEKRGEACRITCKVQDAVVYSEELDFFEALVRIRVQLERLGFLPQCYGAVLNAYPSGMSRDMGQGLRVYLNELGIPGGDLVETFAVANGLQLSTVEEQETFHGQWIDSLR